MLWSSPNRHGYLWQHDIYFSLKLKGHKANLSETRAAAAAAAAGTEAKCAASLKAWLQCHLQSMAAVDHGDSFMPLSFTATFIPVMAPDASNLI